jgi:hypothetical protein
VALSALSFEWRGSRGGDFYYGQFQERYALKNCNLPVENSVQMCRALPE